MSVRQIALIVAACALAVALGALAGRMLSSKPPVSPPEPPSHPLDGTRLLAAVPDNELLPEIATAADEVEAIPFELPPVILPFSTGIPDLAVYPWVPDIVISTPPPSPPEPAPMNRQFGMSIRLLQRVGLEVAILYDPGVDVGKLNAELADNFRRQVKAVTYLVPNARVALVPYHDRRPGDDVGKDRRDKPALTKLNKEGTDSLEALLLATAGAHDAGYPSLAQSLTTAATLSWTPRAKKKIIVVGDRAPARPWDVLPLARRCRDAGIDLWWLDASGDEKVLYEFDKLAHDAGGVAWFYRRDVHPNRDLIHVIFGPEFAAELNRVSDALWREDK